MTCALNARGQAPKSTPFGVELERLAVLSAAVRVLRAARRFARRTARGFPAPRRAPAACPEESGRPWHGRSTGPCRRSRVRARRSPVAHRAGRCPIALIAGADWGGLGAPGGGAVDGGAASSGCLCCRGRTAVRWWGSAGVRASSPGDPGPTTARAAGAAALRSACGCTIMNGSMWFACWRAAIAGEPPGRPSHGCAPIRCAESPAPG